MNIYTSVVAALLTLNLAACSKQPEPQQSEASKPSTSTPSATTTPVVEAPKPGFDISRAPVVAPQLGGFPYFSLIEGYHPDNSNDNKEVTFDRYEFFDGVRIIPVEGRLATIAAEGKGASAYQVLKTYLSLASDLGGVKVYEGKGKDMRQQDVQFTDMRHRHPVFGDDQMGVYVVRMPDREIWIEAYVKENNKRGEQAHGKADEYYLTVVEKKALEVKASLLPAEQMKKELDTKGHVALYINFDFDKSDIRSESRPIIEEVVKLLQNDPDLKLTIEGHTDNAGTPQYNKRLSDARAKSVVAALVARGVDAGRLSAIGHGQEKPIESNNTDEGRAKNRRVELVKR